MSIKSFIEDNIIFPLSSLCTPVKYWYVNFKFFLPHIIKMRDWDSGYQIRLFASSLKYLANGIKQQGHLKQCDRIYKRCLIASELLTKAYNFEPWTDTSYRYQSDRNPIVFKPLDNGHTELTHEYAVSKNYYSKMSKVINKRLNNQERNLKKDAWGYINKYIEYFWD